MFPKEAKWKLNVTQSCSKREAYVFSAPPGSKLNLISSRLTPPLQHWWQAVNIIVPVISVFPELSMIWNHKLHVFKKCSAIPYYSFSHFHRYEIERETLVPSSPCILRKSQQQVVSSSISVTSSSSPKWLSNSWWIYSHLLIWSCPITSFFQSLCYSTSYCKSLFTH